MKIHVFGILIFRLIPWALVLPYLVLFLCVILFEIKMKKLYFSIREAG